MSPRAGASPTAPARWPWLVLGSFVSLAAIGLWLAVVNEEPPADQVPWIVAFGMFGVIGALITSRDRRNRIGLLLLYGSTATAVSFLTGEITTYLISRATTTGVVVSAAALVANVGWLFGIIPVLFLVPLLFPDGRLPSPRWRPFVLWVVLMPATVLILTAFGSPRLSGSTESVSIPNPLFVPELAPLADSPALTVLFIVTIGGSVGATVMRFRRSRGVERQQIKWVAFAALVLFGALLTSDVLLAIGFESPLVDPVLVAGSFLLLPVSIGVAVLRYRLYELDVVVRKTLVATILAVSIAVVYAAIVAIGSLLLGRDDPTFGVIAAVALALAFQPARVRARRLADRLVYGRRATPYEVLSEFSERVAEAYAEDDVLARMARVLAEGVGADRAEIWLRIGPELRPAAAWPEAREVTSIPAEGRSTIPGMDAAVPVEHQGEELGFLAIAKPASEPVTPSDRKLVEGLAGQAGLVLRNVRLTEELRGRLEDLKSAQRRLVTAQDEERRRIERNIHDGAQQQLVALGVKLRLARGLIARDPSEAEALIAQLQDEVTVALDDLRNLARGIYPPLLADRGLPAALEAQGRRSPVPVELSSDGTGRYPPEVEAAVYFCCLEALQNVVKYADASTVAVRLSEGSGVLRFEVVDDGRGFDVRRVGSGTGIQGMVDRLRALEGELEVHSSAGSGTRVVGVVPVVGNGPAAALERSEATVR